MTIYRNPHFIIAITLLTTLSAIILKLTLAPWLDGAAIAATVPLGFLFWIIAVLQPKASEGVPEASEGGSAGVL